MTSSWHPRTDAANTDLVYRSIFTSVDQDLRGRAADLFAAWATGKNAPISAAALLKGATAQFVTDGTHNVVRSSVGSYTEKASGSRLQAAAFRLEEYASNGTSWTTSLRIAVPWQDKQIAGPEDSANREGQFGLDPQAVPWPDTAWAWLDLEHHRGPDGVPVRPGSPRLIRDLLAAVEGTDASLPLTSEVLDIAESHVDELCNWLFDSGRRVPVIVFSPDPQATESQRRFTTSLARDVAGVAVVVRLHTAAAVEFSRRVGPALHVYGGAMRTYLPGLQPQEPFPRRHRVLSAASIRALGARSANAVRDQVLDLSSRRTPPASYALVRRALSRRSADWVDTDRQSPRRPVAQQTHLPAPNEPTTLPGLDPTKPIEPTVHPELDPTTLPPTAPTPLETADGNRLLRATLTLAGVDPSTIPLIEEPADTAALETERRALQDLLLDSLRSTAGSGAADDNATISAKLAEADDEIAMLYTEIDELTARLGEEQTVREERDIADLEIAELERGKERLGARIRWLESELTTYQVHVAGLATPDEPILPTSVVEALELAGEHLSCLSIGATSDAAAGLDVHPQAERWAIKIWQALTALNAYAEARASGSWANSFLAWCQQPPSGGIAVPATWVALNESETTNTSPKLREARVFTVPNGVDTAGRIYMAAHVKIQQGGTPCPRIHFHDDAGGSTAQVYVGYVGDHLPTANFR